MSRIAAQLYTLRDYTTSAAGFRTTLRRIAEMGYRYAQLSAVGCMDGASPEVDAKAAKELLDDAGIQAALTHRPWDEIRNRTDECIAFHKALGAELVGIGSMPGEYRKDGADGFRRFADDAAEPIARLKAAGLLFAYHNHSFEFERFPPHGQTGFEIMIERGPSDMKAILDTYWVVHAGVDLGDLVSRLHGRIPMIHVKDKAVVEGEVRMAPVGEGNLNWDAILPACAIAGTGLYAVEQDDCYGRDPFECLASSYRFLEAKLPKTQ
ncbi:MAG TPA: sugar phosphate isomerase/epimerase [Fimbriimonadaceae bacterium]|nr:sugar phosphate isomerase/epimerase [Fimbriimonadaceae bacterium]